MTCFKYFLHMNFRNGNRTSISIWNKEQVLGNGVLINGSLCEPVKRKKEDTWCTIMSDGWTRPTKLSIINFIVYSKGTTMFLKLVDASNNIKDIFKGGSIKEMMRRLISKFFIYESVVPKKQTLITSRIWLLVHN